MLSQTTKGPAAVKNAGGSGSGNAAPATSKSRARGEISFVAFDAGINKDTRRAVRVQAARASAGARKATIARKLAARKRGEGETQLEATPATKGSKPVDSAATAKSDAGDGGSRTLQLPQPRQHTFVTHTHTSVQLAVQSPSTGSSGSSGNVSDAETDLTKPSRSASPATRQKQNAVMLATHSKALGRLCRCKDCKQITPSSSTASSPKHVDDFEPRASDQFETMRAIARYAVPRPSQINSGGHDPFGCYPVQWQPWYDGLLHYMMTVFAPRAWPVLNITSSQGTKWEWFMTQHAMEEPALFYVRLLFASGDLIRIGVLNRECSYWLQSQAIKTINEALRDSKRSVCDGLILAVGRIALHECMYGDRNAANSIHRPAQRRMIDMRGGMSKLGFPDLVKKLMRWSDRVMSMQGNTHRLLPDDEDKGNSTYGLKQSVDVYEAWAPETGQALRNKMAIANLLTD